MAFTRDDVDAIDTALMLFVTDPTKMVVQVMTKGHTTEYNRDQIPQLESLRRLAMSYLPSVSRTIAHNGGRG